MEDPTEEILLGQIPKAQKSHLRPKTVSSILDRLIVERGYAAQQSTLLIQEQWRIAVGEKLFCQSRVGKIQRGVLHILVANTIVLTELEFVKKKALHQIQTALPDFRLKSIRLKISN
jgi:hypothetical protein